MKFKNSIIILLCLGILVGVGFFAKKPTETQKQITQNYTKPKTFGPWLIKELKEDGWENKYTRVAPAKGLSRVWVIGTYRTARFSTNPPNQDVYFKTSGKGKPHPLDEEVEVKGNQKFYFGSRTGKRITIYIIEGPSKN